MKLKPHRRQDDAMSYAPPSVIASGKSGWHGRIPIPNVQPQYIQARLTDYASRWGVPVVGYVHSDWLTIMYSPESRKGYRGASEQQCQSALLVLAAIFGTEPRQNFVGRGYLHVLMGRNKGGYTPGEIAPPSVASKDLPTLLDDVTMVSARVLTPRSARGMWNVEPHSEPAIAGIVPLRGAPGLHKLADELRQHHYLVQQGVKTDVFETRWAQA